MIEQYPTLLVEFKGRHDIVREQVAMLDQIMQELETKAAGKEVHTTLRQLADFFTGDLCRLMELEEEVVFAPLERAIHEIGGPVAALQLEHEALKQLVEVFDRAVAEFQRNSVVTAPPLRWCAVRLRSLLLLHLEKEETVLFDIARKVLTLDDWAEAIERARLWEQEAEFT
jgi:hemerythrin-like domain-containing protein